MTTETDGKGTSDDGSKGGGKGDEGAGGAGGGTGGGDGGDSADRFKNVDLTRENLSEALGDRDRAREKTRAANTRAEAAEKKLSEISDGEKSAKDQKAKDEGDWKALLESRESDLVKAKEEGETQKARADTLESKLRTRLIMDVVKPELAEGVSQFMVRATISELDSQGLVEVAEDADPKDLGKAILTSIAKHVPELLKGGQSGKGGDSRTSGSQKRRSLMGASDSDKVNAALGSDGLGSVTRRLLGEI